MPTSGYQQPSPQPPVPKKQKLTQFPKLKHGNDKIIFTVSDEIHAKMLQKLHYESKDFSNFGKKMANFQTKGQRSSKTNFIQEIR